MKYIFYVIIFLFCLSSQAKDLTTQAKNLTGQPITLFTIAAPEIPPFIYKNDKGDNDGLIIDTINKLNASGKFNITVEIMPWARAMKAVEKGYFDALMPTVQSTDRTLYLSFATEPLINFYGSQIFKRVDDSFDYQGIARIDKNKIIVKVRSTQISNGYEQAFNDAGISFVEATRLEDAFNMLIHGHVDLLISDTAIAQSTIKRMDINEEVKGFAVSEAFHSSYLAFSKEYAKNNDINAIMAEINLVNDPDSYHRLSLK